MEKILVHGRKLRNADKKLVFVMVAHQNCHELPHNYVAAHFHYTKILLILHNKIKIICHQNSRMILRNLL